MDWELLLPFGFALLAPMGFLCSVLGGYRYWRFEKGDGSPNVPTGIVIFATQYALVLVLYMVQGYLLLPTILMSLIAVALITVLRLGLQAHSPAGRRLSLAGLLTLCAYLSKLGSDYYQFLKFHFPL